MGSTRNLENYAKINKKNVVLKGVSEKCVFFTEMSVLKGVSENRCVFC